MDAKLIMPILIAAFVAWRIYARVRRTIGRQPLQPGRMKARMIILGIVGVLVLAFSFRNLEAAGALLAGLAGGAALGYFGVRHTKFENTPQGQFYTPHTYIGLFVTLLFLGRIAYRFFALYQMNGHLPAEDPNPFVAIQRSPLTLAIFGIVIGYYIAYFAGVLKHAQTHFAPIAPPSENNVESSG